MSLFCTSVWLRKSRSTTKNVCHFNKLKVLFIFEQIEKYTGRENICFYYMYLLRLIFFAVCSPFIQSLASPCRLVLFEWLYLCFLVLELGLNRTLKVLGIFFFTNPSYIPASFICQWFYLIRNTWVITVLHTDFPRCSLPITMCIFFFSICTLFILCPQSNPCWHTAVWCSGSQPGPLEGQN